MMDREAAYIPGRAMNASDCRAISAFLWCMSATGRTSPTVSPLICMPWKHAM